MTGFATLVANIRSDMDRGTSYDARIRKAIENAIKFYRAQRFGFNEKRKGLTTNTEYTSLTANFIEMDRVRIDITTDRILLTPTTMDFIDARNTQLSASDQPVYYTVYNRQLRLSLYPKQTYSFEIAYCYDLGGISICASDSSSNAWTNEGEELIATHAMCEMYEVVIGGDELQAKCITLRAREQLVLKELKRRAAKEQASGRVEPFL